MNILLSNWESRFRKVAVCVLAAISFAMMASAQTTSKGSKDSKREKENAVTTLKIVVTGGKNNVPISNASVYLRYEEPRFLRHASQIELDLKTDQEGIAKIKDVPQKRILIQVVKDGWKPFGEHYVLDKEEMTINIQMQPPAHWY